MLKLKRLCACEQRDLCFSKRKETFPFLFNLFPYNMISIKCILVAFKFELYAYIYIYIKILIWFISS